MEVSKKELERRRKISSASKKRWATKEFCKKQAQTWTDERREKCSERQAKITASFWEDPEYREHMTSVSRNYWSHRSSRKAAKKRMHRRYENQSERETQSLKLRIHYVIHPEKRSKVRKRMIDEYANGKRKAYSNNSRYHVITRKGGEIICKSSWERNCTLLLDSLLLVQSFEYEPFFIRYEVDGVKHYYFPDFLITLRDGRRFLLELKPLGMMPYGNNKHKIEALKKFCSVCGIGFALIHNNPTLDTLRFLA
jgi:hypothetical protein